jgi:hypothetical protein
MEYGIMYIESNINKGRYQMSFDELKKYGSMEKAFEAGKAKMTVLETSVLNIIATSEYNQLNGSIPRTVDESSTWLWTDELAADAGLTVNQVKGVLGSLVKKGLVDIDDLDADSCIQITKLGINELW